jgi:YD repeat-containing protein
LCHPRSSFSKPVVFETAPFLDQLRRSFADDTNSLSSTMNWTAALGPSSAAGPNGDTASFGYDSNGRPTSTTAPTGAVTNYTYDDSASGTKQTLRGVLKLIVLDPSSKSPL